MHAYSYKIFFLLVFAGPQTAFGPVVDGHQTAHNSMIAGTKASIFL